MKNGKNVILCIDDDPDFLDSLRIIIESADYITESADSAEAGLKKYKEVNPDLIIVDLMMEEVDAGTNFVKEIKALGKTPPIYMLSSVGDSLSTNTDYTRLGLDGVFQKPIKPNILLETIATRLKKK
ncbi:MAG: response regulator [Kiritimatiellae bacterium]|nr:response regulator [Kiritimatiellia bacterium]MDD5523166.1 response regulator [Kiritimatiellia bacterium]